MKKKSRLILLIIVFTGLLAFRLSLAPMVIATSESSTLTTREDTSLKITGSLSDINLNQEGDVASVNVQEEAAENIEMSILEFALSLALYVCAYYFARAAAQYILVGVSALRAN